MTETTATVIADTVHNGYRITTVEVEYPRFILAELNTHRLLTRSSASSRAIPVLKRIKAVRMDPVIPVEFGRNRRGMQADEELTGTSREKAESIWLEAVWSAADYAEALIELGVHKQVANRILEPFVTVRTVITATEWDNFFSLRISKEAQPEMRVLAEAIKEAIDGSEPRHGYFHVPYVSREEFEELGDHLSMIVSAARCARVSYKTHDGKDPNINSDMNLAHRLLKHRHMSPFDHQAFPSVDGQACRQYLGWCPYRKEIEKFLQMKCSRLED